MVDTRLEETMKPRITFFQLLCPTNIAFSAWMISISTDVAANFALSRIVTRATVCIDLEPYLHSRSSVANLHRLLVG